MGYPTKVQLIQRKESQQWYINFPAAIAQAMDFAKGEDVQWTIADKRYLILARDEVPPDPIDVKKLRPPPSSRKNDPKLCAGLLFATGLGACSSPFALAHGLFWQAHGYRTAALTGSYPTGLDGRLPVLCS